MDSWKLIVSGHSVFNFDRISHRAEASVADAGDEHKVFGLSESAEFFAMFDDLCGELFADVGKLFEFFEGSRVDIYCGFRKYDLRSLR